MAKNDLDKIMSVLKGIDDVEVEEIHGEPNHASAFKDIAQDTKECYNAFCNAGFNDTRAWSMTRLIMNHILTALDVEED